ncbi:MAG TPA: DUF2971 domain-containing protein [Bradyrhizobium sp.]|jgi:hypothetical protein|nr:DUF2971 domain-containing protein [Bradyrhizobium sp.]
MSNAIDRFLKSHINSFNLSTVFSDEAKKMEEEFSGTSVYKYYSDERRGFFKAPQVRFTQKGNALNDPFELTRRWEEFGSPPTIELMTNYVREPVLAMMKDPAVVLDVLCEKLTEAGTPFNRQFMEQRLVSREGRVWLSQRVAETEVMVDTVMPIMWKEWSDHSDDMVESIIREMGIFSVSTTPISQPMWGLYASSGSGFIVNFRARHDFFMGRPSGIEKSLLRKVHYTDQRIPEFWSNPCYLFAVKETEWAFEKELRLIKNLTDCKEIGMVNGIPLLVMDVVPGMIDSIVFGYNYDKSNLYGDMSDLRAFDPAVRFEQAVIDLSTSKLRVQPL